MNIVVYIGMQKDVNSTAIPIGVGQGVGGYESAITYPCEVFEPCSVLNPIIKIEPLAAFLENTIKRANYAYIADYGRYYWINDIHYEKGFWYLHLNVDVLASWRTAIGNSTQYVLRSESQSNGDITDTLYIPEGGRVKTFTAADNSVQFADEVSNGTFVFGINSPMSAVAAGMGSTYYAKMSIDQCSNFVNQLLGTGAYLNIDESSDITQEMVKVILNPLQYIQSCKWFPTTWSSGFSERYIPFGWWSLTAFHSPAFNDDPLITKTFTITLPRHPQIATHGEYLKRSPYSAYTLFIPVAGPIDLDSALLYDAISITVGIKIDIPTGTAVITVSARDESDHTWSVIDGLTCELSVDIPLAQISSNKISTVLTGFNAAADTIGNVLSGNILGGITSLVNGAMSTAFESKKQNYSAIGTPGSVAAFRSMMGLYFEYQPITDNANSLFGKPLCAARTINTLSGFVMCGRAHMLIPGAMAQETERIEAFMNGGFRYE